MGLILLLLTYFHLTDYVRNLQYDMGFIYGAQNKTFSETQPFPYGMGVYFDSRLEGYGGKEGEVLYGFKFNSSKKNKFFSTHILIGNRIKWLRSYWLAGFPEIYLGTHWSVDHSTKIGAFLYHIGKFYNIKFNLLSGTYYTRYAKFKKNAWLKTDGRQGLNLIEGFHVWKEWENFGFHFQYQVEGPILQTHFKQSTQLKFSFFGNITNNRRLSFNLISGFTYFDLLFKMKPLPYLGFSISILGSTRNKSQKNLNKKKKEFKQTEKEKKGKHEKQPQVKETIADTSQITLEITVVNSAGWKFIPPFKITCIDETNHTRIVCEQRIPLLESSWTCSTKIRRLIWQELLQDIEICQLHLLSDLYKVDSFKIDVKNQQIKILLVPKWE